VSLFRFFSMSAVLLLALASPLLFAADNATMPGSGFAGDRYAGLWTKSPFAIATPDAPAASADYQLVGIAQFDGISYASLVNRQTQEHFVVTSEKPFKNLTLVSITPGKGGSTTSAVVQRNGQPLTLTLEQAPAAVPGAPGQPPPNMGMPGMPAQPIALAPTLFNNPSVGGVNYPNMGMPPHPRIHRPPIFVPPPR
jgi:hypothetical protein